MAKLRYFDRTAPIVSMKQFLSSESIIVSDGDVDLFVELTIGCVKFTANAAADPPRAIDSSSRAFRGSLAMVISDGTKILDLLVCLE